jgi:general secretion pathway protein G
VLKHLQSKAEWNEKSLGAKGFTLIELLVVIVILGILAAVVVFSVRGITDKGDSSACKAQVSTIETAVEAYRAQYGAYPPAGNVTSGNVLTTTFLKKVPDTKWGTPSVDANGNVSGMNCP